jgi:hypothetical protein
MTKPKPHQKLLEKIAYCGLHKMTNAMWFEYPMGGASPDAWPEGFSEQCSTCRERMDAAKKALAAGVRVGHYEERRKG